MPPTPHLDLAIWNFGIQESVTFNEPTREVFPGAPTLENGYMYVNEAPGFGVDLNEELAAKYPPGDRRLLGARPQTRRHRRATVMDRRRCRGRPGSQTRCIAFGVPTPCLPFRGRPQGVAPTFPPSVCRNLSHRFVAPVR